MKYPSWEELCQGYAQEEIHKAANSTKKALFPRERDIVSEIGVH